MENPYKNKDSIEYRFRKNRFKHVRVLIDSVLAEKQTCRILDIGGTELYWDIGSDLVDSGRLEIDLLNLNAPDVEKACFRGITGNACDMSEFADNSYDLCHSNSVIEHVGVWKDMMAMAREVRRLAPIYFVQVPNFWFPYEPHYRFPIFHWFPEQLRYRLIMRRKLGFYKKMENVSDAVLAIQEAKLLDRSQLAALFPDAEIISEKFAFLTKSLMAVRASGDSAPDVKVR